MSTTEVQDQQEAPTKNGAVDGELDAGLMIDGVLFEAPNDWTIGEAEMIKSMTDLTPQDLLLTIATDSTDPTCLRALAWTVLYRADAKTEWDDDRITKSSVGLFFKEPEKKAGGRPPGGRRKRS